MADTLETLEIKIEHSSTGAAGELRKVASAIRSISKALDDAIPKLSAFDKALKAGKGLNFIDVHDNNITSTLSGVTKGAKSAGAATKSAASGVKELSKEANKSKGPLDNLVSSLKRIAFYRIIRSIIKAIGQAFKEGSENAYFFSESIATTGHRFATALNELSTKTLTMKNQLGSAFNALMTAVAPVIEYLIGLVTKLADALSQFFSIFTGGTYLKAVDVPNKWATDTNKAAKAAKEWKNQLLGFDEINRLEEPNNSGGGGNDKLDPTTMYEDTPISGIFAKIKKELDEFWGSIDFEPLKKAWADLKKSIQDVADIVGGALKWGWDNVLKPLAKWTMEKLTPSFITLLSAAFGLLSAALVFFKPLGKWLWDNFLQPLANFIGDTIISFIENLTSVIEGLTSVLRGDTSLTDFIGNLSAVQYGILGLIALLTGVIIRAAFSGFSKSIGKFLSTPLGKLATVIVLAVYAFQKVKEAIALFNEEGKVTPEVIGKILEALGAVAIAVGLFTSPWVVLAGVIAWAVGWVITHWDKVKAWVEEHCPWMVTAWNGLKDAWQTFKDKIAEGKADLIRDWDRIKAGWVNLKASINNGIENVKAKWQSFKDKIAEGKADLNRDWENIKQGWINLKASISNGVENLKSKWQTFKDKIREGKEDLVKDWNRIKEGWVGLKASIANGVENLKAKWQTFKDKIAEGKADLVKDWNRIKEGWVGLKASINNGIENVKAKWQTFRDKIAEGKADLVNDWNRIQSGWVNLKASISNGVENLKSKWDSFKAKIAEGKADLAQDWENLKQTWLNLKASIANGIENLKLNWDALKNRVIEAIDKIKAKWDELKSKWDEKLEPLREAVANWKESWVSAFNAVRNAIVSLFGWILTAWTAFKGFLNDLTSNPIGEQWGEDNTFISPTDGRTIKMPFMNGAASGGVFDEGEIFVAREAGPEMVGTIGGHTAVANNDQIVEGIRQGVFEAVSAAMSNRSGGTQEIKVYLDSREIRAGQQRLNRAWGA